MNCSTGHEIQDGSKFCNICGEMISRCMNGHQVLKQELFCGECGVKLNQEPTKSPDTKAIQQLSEGADNKKPYWKSLPFMALVTVVIAGLITVSIVWGSGNKTHTAPVVRHHHKTTTTFPPPSQSVRCMGDATGVVGDVLRNLGDPAANNYLNSALIQYGANSVTWQAIQSGISAGAPVTVQQGYVNGISAALTALISVCKTALG
jgi:predicted RNA-binding Zn-ribbon protein involved in translation (DUF1610 family)